MTTREVATKMRKLRAEMDECAEWYDRIANEVEAVKPLPAEIQLVGMHEAAELLGVLYNTLAMQRSRGAFIEPLAKLRCGPVWLRDDVLRFKARRAA